MWGLDVCQCVYTHTRTLMCACVTASQLTDVPQQPSHRRRTRDLRKMRKLATAGTLLRAVLGATLVGSRGTAAQAGKKCSGNAACARGQWCGSQVPGDAMWDAKKWSGDVCQESTCYPNFTREHECPVRGR
jgi:hypothetical protein